VECTFDKFIFFASVPRPHGDASRPYPNVADAPFFLLPHSNREIKSVTIWFQNKRQTERKTAANNLNNGSSSGGGTNSGHHGGSVNLVPNVTGTLHTFSLHHSETRTASPPFSVSSRSSGGGGGGGTSAARPSLDRVASRSELRAAAPRTPRRANPTGAIWDNMPSSPLVPPISPPAREFIELGGKNTKTRRTLEWACAAARLADKDGYASGMTSGFGGSGGGGGSGSAMSVSSGSSSASSTGSRGRSMPKERSSNHGRIEKSRQRRDGPSSSLSSSSSKDVDMDLTDEEDVEAITPPSTWGKDDRRWVPTATNEGSHSLMALTSVAASGGPLPKGVDDDDMFKAALALCGLGRRT